MSKTKEKDLGRILLKELRVRPGEVELIFCLSFLEYREVAKKVEKWSTEGIDIEITDLLKEEREKDDE